MGQTSTGLTLARNSNQANCKRCAEVKVLTRGSASAGDTFAETIIKTLSICYIDYLFIVNTQKISCALLELWKGQEKVNDGKSR